MPDDGYRQKHVALPDNIIEKFVVFDSNKCDSINRSQHEGMDSTAITLCFTHNSGGVLV